MRLGLPNLLVLAAVGVAASGCTVRFKGIESFNAATTPVKYSSQLPDSDPGKWHGDPGSFGGIANGSGGVQPKTHYGEGSDPNSQEPVNPLIDQPAKGVGQQPGEFHQDSGTGYGQSNAPVAQPSPSSANSQAGKAAH